MFRVRRDPSLWGTSRYDSRVQQALRSRVLFMGGTRPVSWPLLHVCARIIISHQEHDQELI